MLTGRLPFEGNSAQEVLVQHITGEPKPIASLREGLPEDLLDAVERCLEREPGQRWASADALLTALRAAATGEYGEPTSSRHRAARAAATRSRARRWTWAGAVAVAVVAAVVWMAVRGSGSSRSAAVPSGMVPIPAGTYLIGSDEEPRARPAHGVTLPAFALDRTEVTVGAYRPFAAATNADVPWTGQPDSLLPVTGVRWSEASAYCAWRGARLPSEFEWEAAARGPEGRRYAWGNVIDTTPAGDLRDTALAEIGRVKATHPVRVGSHPRGDTPLGAADLIGNVWEWTSSRMLPYPGGAALPGGDTLYVIRGGAYGTRAAYTTTFYRGAYAASPASRRDIAYTGFRCAASLPQGEAR